MASRRYGAVGLVFVVCVALIRSGVGPVFIPPGFDLNTRRTWEVTPGLDVDVISYVKQMGRSEAPVSDDFIDIDVVEAPTGQPSKKALLLSALGDITIAQARQVYKDAASGDEDARAAIAKIRNQAAAKPWDWRDRHSKRRIKGEYRRNAKELKKTAKLVQTGLVSYETAREMIRNSLSGAADAQAAVRELRHAVRTQYPIADAAEMGPRLESFYPLASAAEMGPVLQPLYPVADATEMGPHLFVGPKLPGIAFYKPMPIQLHSAAPRSFKCWKSGQYVSANFKNSLPYC